jgi:hypothetical protein
VSAGDKTLGTGGNYVGVASFTESTPAYTITATANTVTTVVIGLVA